MINETRASEGEREIRNWEEVQEFLGNSYAARAKAREIIEEYLEGNGKEQRTER